MTTEVAVPGAGDRMRWTLRCKIRAHYQPDPASLEERDEERTIDPSTGSFPGCKKPSPPLQTRSRVYHAGLLFRLERKADHRGPARPNGAIRYW